MNWLAYNRGKNDFLRGVWKTDNPYPENKPQLFNSWIEGWMSQKNRNSKSKPKGVNYANCS